MKSRYGKIVCTIIILELVAIVILTWRLFHTYYQNNILGFASVSPLNIEDVRFLDTGETKYFYELRPGSVETGEFVRYMKDPTLSPITNVEPTWSLPEITYTINSDGLNERYEYTATKTPNTFRIITLGDSFTFGQHVNTKDNYSEKLEDILYTSLLCPHYNKFEVINLGVPGYDIDFSEIRFRTRGGKYVPDLVLWYLLDNDFMDYQRGEIERVVRYQSDPSIKEKYHGDISSLWIQASSDAIQALGGEAAVLNFQYEKLVDFITHHNVPLMLVTHSKTQEKFKKLLQASTHIRPNVFYYEISETLDLLPDDHPSIMGHEQIARNIFLYLKNLQFASCKKS